MSIKKTWNIAIPFCVLVIVYGLIIHSFFDITKVTFIKYALSQVFVIVAPGLVCTKYIFGNRDKSVVHWISLSYVFGYSVNILEYIIIWGLHLQQFATPIILVITVLVCFLWFYKPIDMDFDDFKENDYVLLFIFMAYMLISVIAFSGNRISPFIGQGGTSIGRDLQFWCANAVSLKNSFLPETAYFSGTTFYYHYFSSMHVAFISQVTGISVFDVAFTLFSFGKCVLLIGALNYLIDRYRLGSIKYLFYLFILFMTGWEEKPFIIYVGHLTCASFGLDIGFAFGLWLIAFVLQIADNPEFNIRDFLAIMLIWTTLCGAKGPVAALLILVPGLFCFIWLFQRKYKMAFVYGLTFLGIFAIINIFCLGIIRILNHTADSQVDNIGGFRSVYEVVQATPYGALTGTRRFLIPAWIWYAFNAHPVLFVITVVNSFFLIWMLLTKKIRIKDCMNVFVLLFTTIFGIMLGMFYNPGGHSEMYFTMTAYIPCLAYNLEMYKNLLNTGEVGIGWRNAAYKTGMILTSIVGLYCWGFTQIGGGGMSSRLGTGYSQIIGDCEYVAGKDTFTKREADACAWLRDNTLQDSVIQSNRFLVYPNGSYFISMFSERIQYLEADDLVYYCDLGINEPKAESRESKRRGEVIEEAFDGDGNALAQLKEEGVDYLVQDNLLYENKLESSGLTAVYDENDIVIYKLK